MWGICTMLQVGQQVGNYKIVSEIAQGTYANVYKATHSVLTSRIVALKILLKAFIGSENEANNSLYQEAHILERLQHPHILALIDLGTYENYPYIVKEYAANGSLRERLHRLRGQAQPYNEAITILRQVGEALQFAHQEHVIHCDLKPENVLFNAQQNALVADFDIARVAKTIRSSVASLGGTPAYMAPEQFHGKAYSESDQYSLACMAYEMLTGRRPFQGQNTDELRNAHMHEDPIPPTQANPRLPQHIDQALLRALEKDVKARFPTISAFIEALDPLPTNATTEQWAKPVINVGQHLILHARGTTKATVDDDIFYDKTVTIDPNELVSKIPARARKAPSPRPTKQPATAHKVATPASKAPTSKQPKKAASQSKAATTRATTAAKPAATPKASANATKAVATAKKKTTTEKSTTTTKPTTRGKTTTAKASITKQEVPKKPLAAQKTSITKSKTARTTKPAQEQ
jgi:Serine/threonine protein kinase